jgi:hypothetical protein
VRCAVAQLSQAQARVGPLRAPEPRSRRQKPGCAPAFAGTQTQRAARGTAQARPLARLAPVPPAAASLLACSSCFLPRPRRLPAHRHHTTQRTSNVVLSREQRCALVCSTHPRERPVWRHTQHKSERRFAACRGPPRAAERAPSPRDPALRQRAFRLHRPRRIHPRAAWPHIACERGMLQQLQQRERDERGGARMCGSTCGAIGPASFRFRAWL